jgi:hypothetical protein
MSRPHSTATPWPVSSAEIVRRRYVDDGLSIRRIADELHLPRRYVSQVLHGYGIPVEPRGAGRPRPRRCPAPAPDIAAALVDFYLNQRLDRAEVARRLGVSDGRVRTWLRHLGVPVRTRGWNNREDRRRDPTQLIEDLYVTAGLSADEVAAHIGSTRGRVLASAHEGDLPVRPGAAATDGAEVSLLTALYRDRRVLTALARHGVSANLTPGPITERFATPIRLSPQLLADLYKECGLSTTQIELVTGQPAATVRRHLHHAAIPLRHAGGLAPFTRRARHGLTNAVGFTATGSNPDYSQVG